MAIAGDETPVSATSPPRGERTPSYLADHRARLRERFMQGGADALPDYELLELVLFRAIPRQDVKPLARRLPLQREPARARGANRPGA